MMIWAKTTTSVASRRPEPCSTEKVTVPRNTSITIGSRAHTLDVRPSPSPKVASAIAAYPMAVPQPNFDNTTIRRFENTAHLPPSFLGCGHNEAYRVPASTEFPSKTLTATAACARGGGRAPKHVQKGGLTENTAFDCASVGATFGRGWRAEFLVASGCQIVTRGEVVCGASATCCPKLVRFCHCALSA